LLTCVLASVLYGRKEAGQCPQPIRESTNRALRALERKGLIEVQHGQIVLLKPQELESLVDEERM